ncbi:MAG: RNA pseudouridine synthase [Treponema sp.]|nr:RNA pseudouridine synthase [Treponema sp.]
MEGAKDAEGDLPKKIKEYFNIEFTQAVHRLDVPVTGCSLFAVNPESLKYLNSVFARKTAKSAVKKYWAITEKPAKEINKTGELIHWIETNPKINKSFAYDTEKKGRKKAVLKYKIKGEGQNYIFIDVDLFTGRHHQIRSQFASNGLFIKGDLKYGAKRGEKNGGIRLHSRTLCFPDPLSKNVIINITCDPPLIDNLWNEFIRIDNLGAN